MDTMKTGSYLAALRKGAGMTQQEVADRLGVSNKTISKWESGGGFPDIAGTGHHRRPSGGAIPCPPGRTALAHLLCGGGAVSAGGRAVCRRTVGGMSDDSSSRCRDMDRLGQLPQRRGAPPDRHAAALRGDAGVVPFLLCFCLHPAAV